MNLEKVISLSEQSLGLTGLRCLAGMKMGYHTYVSSIDHCRAITKMGCGAGSPRLQSWEVEPRSARRADTAVA